MANPRRKHTPTERLAMILNSNSSLEGVKEFRVQCRDVYRLGGVFGLDHWVDARRDLGLLENPDIERVADDLQAAIGSVIDSITLKPQPKKEGLSWDERQKLINQREHRARSSVRPVGYKMTPSVVTRMQKGFDQILDEEIASVRRGAP